MRTVKGCIAMLFLIAVLPAVPALADTVGFNSPSDLVGWSTDRFAPASFSINNTAFPGNPVLEEDISGAQVQANTFYDYQGEGKNFPLSGPVQQYSIDMYVNTASWGSQTINAGFWSTGTDSANAISAYPIIAYRQGPDALNGAGFYSFDYNESINPSNLWDYLAPANDNAFNNLSITLDVGTGIDYSVNGGTPVLYADADTANLQSVILDSYNSGQDYSVYYDNLSYGVPTAAPLPSTLLSGASLMACCAGVFILRSRSKSVPTA